MKDQLWAETVGYLALPDPLTAKDDSTVLQCIKKLQKGQRGCIVIINRNREVKGIFTERQIMNFYVGTTLPGDAPVKDYMQSDPPVLHPLTSIADALHIAVETDAFYLPVCDDDNRLMGLFSIKNMATFLAEHFPGELLNLPPKKGITPSKAEGG
jgi:CBS domain-containing protein